MMRVMVGFSSHASYVHVKRSNILGPAVRTPGNEAVMSAPAGASAPGAATTRAPGSAAFTCFAAWESALRSASSTDDDACRAKDLGVRASGRAARRRPACVAAPSSGRIEQCVEGPRKSGKQRAVLLHARDIPTQGCGLGPSPQRPRPNSHFLHKQRSLCEESDGVPTLRRPCPEGTPL